jgi:hypothetical protein
MPAGLSNEARVLVPGVTNRAAWRYCCSMEVPKLTNEQQRALRVLAGYTDGCAQPTLLADGFSVCQFVILVIEGFATMRRKPVDIGGREKMMIWLQISPVGQSAVAE